MDDCLPFDDLGAGSLAGFFELAADLAGDFLDAPNLDLGFDADLLAVGFLVDPRELDLELDLAAGLDVDFLEVDFEDDLDLLGTGFFANVFCVFEVALEADLVADFGRFIFAADLGEAFLFVDVLAKDLRFETFDF